MGISHPIHLGISLSCTLGFGHGSIPKVGISTPRSHQLLSLLCPLDGSPASTLTSLCVFLPSFPWEFQAGLRSPWLFPPQAGRDGLRLSQGCVPRAGGRAGWLLCPFPAVPVPALPPPLPAGIPFISLAADEKPWPQDVFVHILLGRQLSRALYPQLDFFPLISFSPSEELKPFPLESYPSPAITPLGAVVLGSG